jgi:hypothetical protein
MCQGVVDSYTGLSISCFRKVTFTVRAGGVNVSKSPRNYSTGSSLKKDAGKAALD